MNSPKTQQPRAHAGRLAVRITQTTEMGTLYTDDEGAAVDG